MDMKVCLILALLFTENYCQKDALGLHANDNGDDIPMMAQPIFQEPPSSAFTHSSNYWRSQDSYEYENPNPSETEVCRETKKDFTEARDHLKIVKEALLHFPIECNSNCTKIIVSSVGRSLLRHPPRFGLYALETLYNANQNGDAKPYPAYTRKASGQSLFYKEEYEKWMYAHKFERWVIGPKIGDENGGLVLLSKDVCPWDINVDTTDVYFYDKLVENTWNPIGNGWRLEPEGGTLSIECYDASVFPPFSCGCNVVNVTSDGGRISEYHHKKLGVYHRVPYTLKLGFLAPVFKKEAHHPDQGDPEQFLYSHHHEGRLWLLGQSYTTWSIRLDLVSNYKEDIKVPPESAYFGHTTHGPIGAFCPTQTPPEGNRWEYLQSRNGEDEIWLKDDKFKIYCVN